MTDYFALLDQPRSPWLDSEKLREAFRAKTMREHPDALVGYQSKADAEKAFAEINAALQVLQDPRRRLHHLLELEGRPPAPGSGMIPKEIVKAFESVAASTQAVDMALQKASGATNPLSRALIIAELSQARTKVNEALDTLRAQEREAEAESRKLDGLEADARFSRLENLYFRYAYLTRWIGQMEEKRAQLSTLQS